MQITKKYLTGKRNFVDWNRRSAVVKRHSPVIIKPLVIAVLGVVFWKFALYDNGISFKKDGENPLLFLTLPLVSFVYVIFASIAVGSVFDEYKTISKAVVRGDLETFLQHRDEQLPILMHILIAAPSVILVALSMLFHYENPAVGAFAVASVLFVVVTTWVVATELDDFQNSIWFQENIPKDWFEVDVKEYFAEKSTS